MHARCNWWVTGIVSLSANLFFHKFSVKYRCWPTVSSQEKLNSEVQTRFFNSFLYCFSTLMASIKCIFLSKDGIYRPTTVLGRGFFLLKTLPSNTDQQRYTLYSSCKTKVGFGLVQAVRTSLKVITYNLWEYAEPRSRPHPSETRGRIKKGSESHVKFGHLERLQRAIDAEENDKLLELNERYKSNANKSDKSDITSTTESLTSSESSYSKRVLDSDTD